MPYLPKLKQLQQLLQQGEMSLTTDQLSEVLASQMTVVEQAHLENIQGIVQVLSNQGSGLDHFQSAILLDPSNVVAQMNLDVLAADQRLIREPSDNNEPVKRATRIAVLSFLFNWPSTGGGIVHTVELCDFLQRAGYQVAHFYARFNPWEIGVVSQKTRMHSQVLDFDESQWNAATIQKRYRQAVDEFHPDYVIITDSWNMKPVLAEAMQGYPYVLRLQALECLCPLNNIRLLPGDKGGFRQCPLNQLATPDECYQCLDKRGQRSGSLHRDERELAGVGTTRYRTTLADAFRKAHAVFVVNPLTEAMVAPYASCVKTVTAGMDPARFPDPWPDDPAPQSGRLKKQILFAGLIDETIKGFAVLHEACLLLWQKRQDFELLITADPVGRIDEYTRTLGWQTQQTLPQLMRSVDIVAVPAIAQEALGRTAVEAMAAGRPVVASRLGGLPFTIPDGATGLLFEPGNPEDLADKLSRLLDDAPLRSALGCAGRKRFLEHYAWPTIIEKHYIPILGAPRRSTSRNHSQ